MSIEVFGTSIKERALEIEAEVIQLRRDFHRHPEVSFEEFRTSDRVAEELEKMGIPYRRTEPTGVIGEISCGTSGKTIALRADMDALSVTEKSDVPFISENPGVMHACGHDVHTAMLLGAAKILNERKESLKGSIRLLFQPAEEQTLGARKIMEQGAIEGVDAIFGMHIFSQLEEGTLHVSDGVLLPSADRFVIRVKGESCHGAMPERGVDATLAAAAIVMNVQSIVSRELSSMEPTVVSIGTFHSGTRLNVISGEAVMEGTVRMFNEENRKRMPAILKRIVEETAAAMRCTAEVEYVHLVEALNTDAEVTAVAMGAAKKLVDPGRIKGFFRTMASEDFSEYTAQVKGAFVGLGGGGTFPQHSDKFEINESTIALGVAMYAQTAVDYLAGDFENK